MSGRQVEVMWYRMLEKGTWKGGVGWAQKECSYRCGMDGVSGYENRKRGQRRR